MLQSIYSDSKNSSCECDFCVHDSSSSYLQKNKGPVGIGQGEVTNASLRRNLLWLHGLEVVSSFGCESVILRCTLWIDLKTCAAFSGSERITSACAVTLSTLLVSRGFVGCIWPQNGLRRLPRGCSAYQR